MPPFRSVRDLTVQPHSSLTTVAQSNMPQASNRDKPFLWLHGLYPAPDLVPMTLHHGDSLPPYPLLPQPRGCPCFVS